MKIITSIKAQAGKIVKNFVEIYTFGLIVLGLPLVIWVLFGWRAALLAALLDHMLVGLLAIKVGAKK